MASVVNTTTTYASLGLTGNLGGGSVSYWGGMYDPASGTALGTFRNATDGSSTMLLAIDISNVTLGPQFKWSFPADTGLEALGFGGGNAYVGGYGEGVIYAIDNETGRTSLASNDKQGNAGYSITYYRGVVYHSASSTQITAYDAATGAIL
jgi:hypothetical protein